MTNKEHLDKKEIARVFRDAFATYKHYVQESNYIGAYVIAFSILEDRVNAMYKTRKRLEYGKCLTTTQVARVPFSKKVKFLSKHQDIHVKKRKTFLNVQSAETQNCMRQCGI